MVVVGKITGREVGTNRDGSNDVVLLQVEVSDEDDVQTVELHRGAGVDLNPPDGSIVVLVSAGDAWQIAATINDNVTPDGLDEGAIEIYSSASGSKVAKFHLAPDGVVTINDGTDYAVQYTALKSAFDELKGDLNALILLYNAHVHTAPNTATVSLFTPPTGSAADMSGAKIEEIKVP